MVGEVLETGFGHAVAVVALLDGNKCGAGPGTVKGGDVVGPCKLIPNAGGEDDAVRAAGWLDTHGECEVLVPFDKGSGDAAAGKLGTDMASNGGFPDGPGDIDNGSLEDGEPKIGFDTKKECANPAAVTGGP